MNWLIKTERARFWSGLFLIIWLGLACLALLSVKWWIWLGLLVLGAAYLLLLVVIRQSPEVPKYLGGANERQT